MNDEKQYFTIVTEYSIIFAIKIISFFIFKITFYYSFKYLDI